MVHKIVAEWAAGAAGPGNINAAGPSVSGGPSRVAGASAVATGMGEGRIVVFSKAEGQPRPAKPTERDVAGTLFGYGPMHMPAAGYGEDGVVVTVVGSSNTGLTI